MAVLVVHLSPGREEMADIAATGARALNTPHTTPTRGSRRNAGTARGRSRKTGDIVELLVGVIDHPHRRRVGPPDAQGSDRPGRLGAVGRLVRKAVVAFSRPLRRHSGQMGGDAAVGTFGQEFMSAGFQLVGVGWPFLGGLRGFDP